MALRRGDEFTKKDLGLLLPDDTPGDPVSLRHTKTKCVVPYERVARFDTLDTDPQSAGCCCRDATDTFEPLKPKVDPSAKVARYRAGQVPRFATGYEEDRGFVTAGSQVRAALLPAKHRQSQSQKPSESEAQPPRRRFEAQVVVAAKAKGRADARARSDSDNNASSDDSGGAANALDDSSSDDDEEEFNRRRRLLRSKQAEKEQSAAAAAETERKVRALIAGV